MQTSLPSTKQLATKDDAEPIQETLGKIIKRIDMLIAILRTPDPVKLPVTPQVVVNTQLTGIVACTSSPAEKDHS